MAIEERGGKEQTDFFLNKNYRGQLDSDTWSYKIILTSLAGHQCSEANTIRDPLNLGLFIVNQYVGLIKEDPQNYGLFMSINYP